MGHLVYTDSRGSANNSPTMNNPQRCQELEKKFGIPGVLRFEDSAGGLVRATVSGPHAGASMYLQGAHIAEWTPRGQRPVLFTSSRSLFTPGKAIRGGVPIIFPWFGARGVGKPGPAHGFARTLEWEFENAEMADGGRVSVGLVLKANEVTRGLGYDGFQLRFRASFAETLEMELEARNDSAAELAFEEALHSYFAIADIDRAWVTGLEGTEYIDKTDGFRRKRLGNEPVRISKETDQVHLNTQAACTIHDPVWERRIVVEKSGSDSTVVWNPWIEKTRGMSDMAPEDWREMICIETANASDNAVRLAPGAVHTLRAAVRVE
jgi:glucose-6-phosphate 1-epimerase